MLDLLNQFSITDIILSLALVLIILKEVLNYFEWGREKGIKIFKNKYQKPKELEQQVNRLSESVDKISEKIDLLMQSDKDDIKAFIVRQHHYFCYQLKAIDDQSLECIERRYDHYKSQGGNSYISSLVQDLRELPKITLQVLTKEKKQ